MLRRTFLALAASAWLAGCTLFEAERPAPAAPEQAQSQAMVAAADPRAVDAGLEMLRQGGTATDAAIATMAVLGLVEPQSAGLGGGAFLLSFDGERLIGYDGRETAPAAATPNLFLGPDGEPLPYPQAVASGLSVGAPGLIPMLNLAHEREGKLPWARLFDPAIRLAEEGFLVSPRLNQWITIFASRGGFPEPGGAEARAYLLTPEGEPQPVGARLTNPTYAATLRAIAKDGPAALTKGPIAEAIVAKANEGPRPGALSLSDLSAYRPKIVEPLCGPFRTLEVCSMPPPASGGVALPALLGLYERARPQPEGVASVGDWAAFLWASRLAYADRDHYLADPAFAPTPEAALTASDYLDARARLIDLAKAPEAVEPGRIEGFYERWGRAPAQPEAGTTHLSVVDAQGRAVAMTATIEAPFGAQRMAAGFFLNNQLTDFSRAPTLGGLPVANAPAPGKRPRSSMSPTMIFEPDGDLYAVLGSPGGNSIIAYVAKTTIALVDWGMSMQEATAAANAIARGPVVTIETERLPAGVAEELEALGWTLRPSRVEASGVNAIRVTPEGLEGGADPRREGAAKVLEPAG